MTKMSNFENLLFQAHNIRWVYSNYASKLPREPETTTYLMAKVNPILKKAMQKLWNNGTTKIFLNKQLL